MSSESTLKEMKGVLLDFYASEMQAGIDKYWDENNMGEGEINYEEILQQTIPFEIAENAIQTILNFPELKQVNPTYFWKLIKEDPDDNKFVDCAICGEAELIVTNDKHFNVLNDIDFLSPIFHPGKIFKKVTPSRSA